LSVTTFSAKFDTRLNLFKHLHAAASAN